MSINRNKEERALLEEYIKTEVKGTYIRFNDAYTILDTQEKSLELASQNRSEERRVGKDGYSYCNSEISRC